MYVLPAFAVENVAVRDLLSDRALRRLLRATAIAPVQHCPGDLVALEGGDLNVLQLR